MNSFEMNKIIGAILGTLLLVMGVGFLAEAIYAPIEGRGPGYALPEPEGAGDHGGEAEVVEEVIALSVLLASASAEKGASVARKCQACHNFEEGDGNKTGPALYGIIGAGIAANDSFGYSDIFVQLGDEGGTWTYDKLNEFLTTPKTFAPGTKMTFAGLRKEEDRADILAYLQTLSAEPVAFPAVEGEAAIAEATPVAEAEPATDADPVAEVAPVVEEPVAEETTETVEEAAPVVEETPVVEEAVEAAVEEAAPIADEASGLSALLASASEEDGARVARKCQACHKFDEGGRNGVGPLLYNVVGADVAANADFRYSDTLIQIGSEGKTWSYEMLDAFLTKPRDFAPGTKMTFAGLRKEEDRANLLVYLRTLSADPVPLP